MRKNNENAEERKKRPFSFGRPRAYMMKRRKIQIRLKSRTHRAAVSLAAALAAGLLWNPPVQSGTPAIGWWGLLYPKFCLVVDENENAADEAESAGDQAKNASKEADRTPGETGNAADRTKSFVNIKPAFWIVEELAKLLN